MKITIDTKEESKENLKKIISFLQNLAETGPADYGTTAKPNEGMFNMFGEDESQPSESKDMFSSGDAFSDESEKEEPKENFNVRDMLERY